MSAHHKLIDPATGTEYLWPVNHSDEEVNGRTRTVRRRDPTAGGWDPAARPVRQQGISSPRKMRFKGRCDDAQHRVFVGFTSLCMTQTVVFYDAVEGDTFEAIVAAYEPQRIPVARAMRTRAAHLWEYSIEIEQVTT